MSDIAPTKVEAVKTVTVYQFQLLELWNGKKIILIPDSFRVINTSFGNYLIEKQADLGEDDV